MWKLSPLLKGEDFEGKKFFLVGKLKTGEKKSRGGAILRGSGLRKGEKDSEVLKNIERRSRGCAERNKGPGGKGAIKTSRGETP